MTLAYDTKYELKLIRQFKDKTLETILTKTIKTIDAVAIISSSISNGSIVYDKPEQMLIETSKTLKSVGQAGASYQENDKSVAFPLTVSFKGKQITISFKEPLPRQKAFTFKLTNVTATDGSQFEQELKIDFEVSGGPKIVAVNIPSYGVEQQPAIRLTFDQELEKEQNLYEKIGFYVEGKPASAGISLNGNSVTVRPGSYMPICAKFKIIVNEKVTSPYGISGDSAWIFDSRVVCHSTFSIGSSVRNRPITAYQFGNSSKIILFVGAMHGNEKNTKNLLHKWIDSLNAHPEKLPSGNSIVVIPVVNPDGVAANTRRNANDIDLNRNFPTSNWQTEVTEPDSNGALTTAGGPSPLSEPESAALASFAQSRNICLALTYHSQAGLIQANDAADSYSIAETYSDLAGYRAIHTYNLGEVFDYNTNGAFEDWMGEKLGLPALLIELYSGTNDEFYLNESAMWAMTKIN